MLRLKLCCPRNQFSKNSINMIIMSQKKSTCFKWAYIHSGINCRVSPLSKSYLTVIGIIIQSRLTNANISKLTKRVIRYRRTDPNYKKASLSKSYCQVKVNLF